VLLQSSGLARLDCTPVARGILDLEHGAFREGMMSSSTGVALEPTPAETPRRRRRPIQERRRIVEETYPSSELSPDGYRTLS